MRNEIGSLWNCRLWHTIIVNELGELISRAGCSEAQMFEEYDRDWICGMGRKPE